MVRSIGADRAVDYTREDFTRGRQRYDLMLDNVGNRPLSACRRVLARDGTYISNAGSMACLLRALVSSPFTRHKIVSLMEKPNTEDLHYLKELLEAGKVTPVIDRIYELSEVPEAIRYLEKGHARGKVVITI
jgi:NADPH:quinone reductase-like Zn-dependent oxidoreductase